VLTGGGKSHLNDKKKRGFLYLYSCRSCSRLKIIFVLEDDGGEQEARAASGDSAAGGNLILLIIRFITPFKSRDSVSSKKT